MTSTMACGRSRDLLRIEGYQLQRAENGTEALAKLESFRPDIVCPT